MPQQADLKHAADVLNAGERVAILVGRRTGRDDEVMQIARQARAGVAKACSGSAVVHDDLPYVTGSIGLLGTKPVGHDGRSATRY